ncbi:hypothetical protein ABKA04_004054 [Annulohypoxylon sp. FPYF3050]
MRGPQNPPSQYKILEEPCFALKDPVCAYWQWTVDGSGVQKRNNTQIGSITSVTDTGSGYQIRFPCSYYAFEGTVSADLASLSVELLEPTGLKGPGNLSLEYNDKVCIPSTSIFTGKLNWLEYCKNEMVVVIIPRDVADDKPIYLIHQWTVDGSGKTKTNHRVNAPLNSVKTISEGTVTAKFDDGFYKYDIAIPRSGNKVTLSMVDPGGRIDSKAPYDLWQKDFRELHIKKALIVRYGTGTDDGIFRVRDMLVKHLGFSQTDVELSYFDVDPDEGPKKCTLGQDPPTAKNFRAKFEKLCSSAVAGDVRCLYVDTHGTVYPEQHRPDEPDGYDEGWTMAANDDGTMKEVIYDDWLAETISNNLKKDVNLTIITSSCMGGGMLDTHMAIPGVLLAGCHETQFNVKALKKMDPWIVGITMAMKSRVNRGRSVPTYTDIYNEAKKFIDAQIAQGQISEAKYKGKSPKEWKPIGRDQSADTSHQDPQLRFYNGYLDPDQERFLYPFQVAGSGNAEGKFFDYPGRQYPIHDEL